MSYLREASKRTELSAFTKSTLVHVNPIVPIDRFSQELEISLATFKCDIEYVRDRLNTPIEWHRGDGGCKYARGHKSQQWSFPGLD